MKQLSQHLYLSWYNTDLGQKGPGSNPGQATDHSFHKNETKINPLSPNINIQILQTDLHTFPLRIRGENLITDQGIVSLVIIC